MYHALRGCQPAPLIADLRLKKSQKATHVQKDSHAHMCTHTGSQSWTIQDCSAQLDCSLKPVATSSPPLWCGTPSPLAPRAPVSQVHSMGYYKYRHFPNQTVSPVPLQPGMAPTVSGRGSSHGTLWHMQCLSICLPSISKPLTRSIVHGASSGKLERQHPVPEPTGALSNDILFPNRQAGLNETMLSPIIVSLLVLQYGR